MRRARACAGPGRARLMAALCCISSSSSFLIFSSMAPPRFSSYASRREGAGRGEARQPPRQARAVRAGAHASHGVSERRRRRLLLGFAEQAAHGCAAQRTRCPRLRCAAPRHASAVASARPGARERRACEARLPASCAAAPRWEARVLCSCLEETRGRGAPHAAAASGACRRPGCVAPRHAFAEPPPPRRSPGRFRRDYHVCFLQLAR